MSSDIPSIYSHECGEKYAMRKFFAAHLCATMTTNNYGMVSIQLLQDAFPYMDFRNIHSAGDLQWALEKQASMYVHYGMNKEFCNLIKDMRMAVCDDKVLKKEMQAIPLEIMTIDHAFATEHARAYFAQLPCKNTAMQCNAKLEEAARAPTTNAIYKLVNSVIFEIPAYARDTLKATWESKARGLVDVNCDCAKGFVFNMRPLVK